MHRGSDPDAERMLPRGLPMLWESVDAADALHGRFGFPDLEAASGWIAEALGEHWGLTVRAVRRLVISDQNVIAWVAGEQGRLIVKWSRDRGRFPALAASTALLRSVAEQGVPVAEPVVSTSSHTRLVLDGPVGPLSVAVLPEIDGEWLDVTDERAVRSAGAVLATVHAALRDGDRDTAALPEQGPDPSVLVHRWLARSDPGHAPEASRRLRDLLSTAPPPPGQQLVHHDYRAANLLTRDAEVVGVLDFDEIARAPCVDDLARASVYLATRFTAWAPTPASARTILQEGYESVAPLDGAERQWLRILTLWYGLGAIPSGEGRHRWIEAVQADQRSPTS